MLACLNNDRMLRIRRFVSACAFGALVMLAAACPDVKPSSFTFSNNQLTTAAFQQVDKLVLVQVQLENSRPLWFVLDSGSARMLVDKRVADSLKLKSADAAYVQGAGAGRVPINLIHDVSIQINGLKSRHHEFASIDLSGSTGETGRPIDGILGYEFLSRFVVTIDYPRQQLIIRDPNSADALPGVPVPLEIEKNWPFIKARLAVKGIPPVTDRFLLDSGSNDAVGHPIIKQLTNGVRQTTTGNGLGQPVSGYIGTADALEIGDFKFKNVTLACCGGTEETSKLIGSGILSRFTVTFDYPHSKIWLRPIPE